MILTETQINPALANQILENAKLKGVSVEVYLTEISAKSKTNSNGNFPKVRKTGTKVDLSLSQKWLKENAHNYIGKWVVLDGDRFIGAGDNPKEFVEKARREGVKIPFVKRIEDNSKPFIGGWL
jgi:Family of unknown function (DUF5678)